jgi:hypothetical protein
MSARLNLNAMPYVSWKGQTLQQITSKIKKNQVEADQPISRWNLFRAQPLKIYRREIGLGTETPTCNSRISASIDQFQMPNGYIITENTENKSGLVNTLETPTTTNLSENGNCTIAEEDRHAHAYVCPVENAKRRVRSSSGLIRRSFKPANNNDLAYFTNTNQYLVSRNRTFKQNQYTHVRTGDVSILPNASMYNSNTYSPNGLSHCKRVAINASNDTFYYLWTTFNVANIPSILQSTPADFQNASGSFNDCFRVVIPHGDYTIEELQNAFNASMLTNNHYYINKRTSQMEFLLKIIFNTTAQKVELQCFSAKIFSNETEYYRPVVNGILVGTPITTPYKRPAFYFPGNSGFASMVGFQSSQPAFYPNVPSIGSITSDDNIGFLSVSPINIYPLYDIVYFKPSNTRFATQGAVSASDRVLRVKYDTIARNGMIFQNTYGSGVGSSIAFYTSTDTYNIKDKIGYPNKQTPVFCRSTGELTCARR